MTVCIYNWQKISQIFCDIIHFYSEIYIVQDHFAHNVKKIHLVTVCRDHGGRVGQTDFTIHVTQNNIANGRGKKWLVYYGQCRLYKTIQKSWKAAGASAISAADLNCRPWPFRRRGYHAYVADPKENNEESGDKIMVVDPASTNRWLSSLDSARNDPSERPPVRKQAMVFTATDAISPTSSSSPLPSWSHAPIHRPERTSPVSAASRWIRHEDEALQLYSGCSW